MNAKTTSHNRFQHYLRSATRRERVRILTVSIVVLLAVLMSITAIGVTVGLVRGFTETLTNLTRAALIVSAVIAVFYMLWKPIARLRGDSGASLVESSDAAFNGRVHTYLDTKERSPNHQFLPLLARDGLAVAKRVPLFRIVPMSAILWPIVFIASLLFVGVGFIQRAPLEWTNAAAHIWAGWKIPNLVAVRSINAQPGDEQVISGENLVLTAKVTGFSADQVTLHVRMDGDNWQTSVIDRGDDGNFDFTLFRVVKPLDYYFSAAYTQSTQHSINVVVPAKLKNISASYHYPEWTRLPSVEKQDVGRISGVKGTQVSLIFTTDKPLQDGFLSFGDQQLTLQQDGLEYSVTLPLSVDGQYQLMDRMLGRQIPISSEQAVVIQGDEVPEIRFDLPGRDVTASPIEEVTVRLVAVDDYAIESLELFYSVNAGEWQTLDLSPASPKISQKAQHVFTLESLGAVDKSDNDDIADPISSGPMQPGDLISYYARAKDHDSSAETDMMLIDVRPFDRRFSQGSGGVSGGGVEAVNEGSEISRRQKEILVATWNLQRAAEASGGDVGIHSDNGKLLADLQVKLAEQARTLADRSEARELVQQGDEIREFVDYLRQAADAMAPSAKALEELAFADAIQPQQLSLQLLQRAEALFADIRLTQQEGQGGGQAQPGKDMAEMFELEMDLARNQYEQPDRGANASSSEKLDDIFEKLNELARRQQVLEEERKNRDQLTREERWRQEKLSRELEQLREQLEQQHEHASQSQQNGEKGDSQSGESNSPVSYTHLTLPTTPYV